MKLYSYVVARDYGFAPNPFNGFCTLATCKPTIRRSAEVGDWIIGTGAKTVYKLQGHLIYAMQVAEILTFNEYWSDPRFAAKRPILNGSLKQMYGDNIYNKQGKKWLQTDSHHSRGNGRRNLRNIARDTQSDRVLVAKRFVYFGRSAPLIPQNLRSFGAEEEDICRNGRGHLVLSQNIVKGFERWLEKQGKWNLCGVPLEFDRHEKVAT